MYLSYLFSNNMSLQRKQKERNAISICLKYLRDCKIIIFHLKLEEEEPLYQLKGLISIMICLIFFYKHWLQVYKFYLQQSKNLQFFFYFRSLKTEVKENIQKFYPAAFEILTYQNYKAKFHTLLFVEEIEVNTHYFSLFLKIWVALISKSKAT